MRNLLYLFIVTLPCFGGGLDPDPHSDPQRIRIRTVTFVYIPIHIKKNLDPKH
jgi:hypothetical protein